MLKALLIIKIVAVIYLNLVLIFRVRNRKRYGSLTCGFGLVLINILAIKVNIVTYLMCGAVIMTLSEKTYCVPEAKKVEKCPQISKENFLRREGLIK